VPRRASGIHALPAVMGWLVARCIAGAAVALGAAVVSAAQDEAAVQGAAAAPEGGAVAAERHADIRRDLVARLDALGIELDLPGVAVVIVKDGEPLLVTGIGLADRDRAIPLDESTPMRLGPIADTMVSTLAAILVDAGRARWDTDLLRGMPTVRLRSAELTRAVRLDALLGHRAGIALDERLWSCARGHGSLIDALAQAEIDPNAGVVESVGNPFAALALLGELDRSDGATLLRARLLEPLDITLSARGELPPRRATGHRRSDSGDVIVVGDGCDASALWPVRGQWASASALVPYVTLLAESGRIEDRRLVSRERLAHTMAPHESASISELTDRRMGLGWTVDRWRGRLRAARSGAEQSHAASIAVLPDSRIAIAALTPIADVDALDALVEGLLEVVAGVAARHEDRAAELPPDRVGSDLRLSMGPGAGVIRLRERSHAAEILLPGERPIALMTADDDGRRAAVVGDMVFVERASGVDHGVLVDGLGEFRLLRRHGLPTLLAPATVDFDAIADAAAAWRVGSLVNAYRDETGELTVSIGLGPGGAPTLLIAGQVPLTLAPTTPKPAAPGFVPWTERWRVVGLQAAGLDIERTGDGRPTEVRLVSPNRTTVIRPRWRTLDDDPRVAAAAILESIAAPEPIVDPLRLTGTLRMPRQAARASAEIVHRADGVRATLNAAPFGTVVVSCALAPGERPRLLDRDDAAPRAGEIRGETPDDAGSDALRRAMCDAMVALRAFHVIDRGAAAVVAGPSDEIIGAVRIATTLLGRDGDDDLRVVLHIEPQGGVLHAIELPDAGPLIMRPLRTQVVDGITLVVEASFDHPTLGVATLVLDTE